MRPRGERTYSRTYGIDRRPFESRFMNNISPFSICKDCLTDLGSLFDTVRLGTIEILGYEALSCLYGLNLFLEW